MTDCYCVHGVFVGPNGEYPCCFCSGCYTTEQRELAVAELKREAYRLLCAGAISHAGLIGALIILCETGYFDGVAQALP